MTGGAPHRARLAVVAGAQRPEALVERLVGLVEPALQHEPVEEPQRRARGSAAPSATTITTRRQRRVGARRASSSVSSAGQQVRVLRERPADDDRGHRRRRGARAPGRSARSRRARAWPTPASAGDEHHREPAARREPVVAARGASERSDEQPADRRRAPLTTPAPSARARNARDEVRLLGAHRVAGEVDGREVARRSAPRSTPISDRGRVQPRVDQVAGRVADRRRGPRRSPPSAAPRQNGISTDESANSAPSTRASLIVAAWPRSANAVPRKMIPIAARNSGIVERREDRAERDRERRPRRSRARRSATRGWPPTPGSSSAGSCPRTAPAALGAARRQVPEAGAEVGAAEHRVGGRCRASTSADAELGSISARHLASRAVRARAAAAATRPRAPSAT